MKFLVTGAAGYIGGFLITKLLQDGHEVVALDRFSHKDPDTIFGKSNKKLSILTVDLVQNPEKLNKIKTQIDVVIHLAGKNNTPDALANPKLFHDVNVTATINILEWARLLRVGKFIYAASASCYGVPKVIPTSEIYPADPQYVYALTKYLGESAVLHWGLIYKLPVVSLRLFSVYGPRKRRGLGNGLFISKFLDAMVAKQPILINGDGMQARDMVYITDVIAAFIAAADIRTPVGIYNVGTGISTPLNRIITLLNYPKVNHLNRPKGEADVTQADISKIKKNLRWSAKVNLEEGIAKTLKEDVGD